MNAQLRMRRRPSPSSAGLDPSTALGGTNEAGAADVQFWAQAGGVEGDAMQMEGDMGGLDPMDHDFGGGESAFACLCFRCSRSA